MATTKRVIAKAGEGRRKLKRVPTKENPNPGAGLQGRPTKYRPEMDAQVFKLMLLGYKEADIAEFFEVDDATIALWKNSFPSFYDSIRAGKRPADMEVVRSMYEQAKGFYVDVDEVKVVQVDRFTSKIETVTVRRYVPPDFRAAARWLGNRQRERWADKSEGGVTDPNDAARAARDAIAAADATTKRSDE